MALCELFKFDWEYVLVAYNGRHFSNPCADQTQWSNHAKQHSDSSFMPNRLGLIVAPHEPIPSPFWNAFGSKSHPNKSILELYRTTFPIAFVENIGGFHLDRMTIEIANTVICTPCLRYHNIISTQNWNILSWLFMFIDISVVAISISVQTLINWINWIKCHLQISFFSFIPFYWPYDKN